MESYEKFMEVGGHSWKCQYKYGNSKKLMEIDVNSEKKYGNSWAFKEVYGDSWKFKEGYGS